MHCAIILQRLAKTGVSCLMSKGYRVHQYMMQHHGVIVRTCKVVIVAGWTVDGSAECLSERHFGTSPSPTCMRLASHPPARRRGGSAEAAHFFRHTGMAGDSETQPVHGAHLDPFSFVILF
jgi:hypothetical protein